jgi:hypothetical protein
MPRELKGCSLGRNAPGYFPGKVLVATISINYQCDTQHEYDEDRVIDLPIGVIQPELKQMRRKVVKVRGCENSQPGAKQNQHIPCLGLGLVQPRWPGERALR